MMSGASKKDKKDKKEKKVKKDKKGGAADVTDDEDSGTDTPAVIGGSSSSLHSFTSGRGSPSPMSQSGSSPSVNRSSSVVAAEELQRQELARKQQAEAEKKALEAQEQQKAEAARKEAEQQKRLAESKNSEEAKKAAAAESAKRENGRAEADLQAEIESLEAAKPDIGDAPNIHSQLYAPQSKDVYESYGRLQSFGRDLNTPISPPEFVFIGRKGHGKSTVLEAFFGEPLAAAGKGTRRPVFLHVINNLSLDHPRITVKRDAVLKEFDHDLEVTAQQLSAELARRGQQSLEEPIVVHYESRSACNITLIDTPGLLEADEPGVASRAQRESLVLSLAKPNERYIVAVEAARDWTKSDVVAFAKKIDPELTRTCVVYTKFHTLLQSFTSTREVNKHLSGTLPDLKTFFVTLPSATVRDKFAEPDKFQKKIYQAYRRDINSLELLRFDKKYESVVGVHAFRRHVLSIAWRNYQESVPRVLKQLRSKRASNQSRVAELDAQLKGLDSAKLRSIASNYVVNFLQVVELLIAGTSEGNPSVNGQSLEEEKNSAGSGGDWVDLYNRVISVMPSEWKIPYWDNKLYGGQQFERLLAEFNAVAGHTEIPEITMDDVATAAGVNKLNNIPNYAWAASDLAQQKSQDSFVPLIEQLTNRAVFIMKRLTDIAERILEGRKKKWLESISTPGDDSKGYPYFTYNVKDLFNKFVDQTAKVCKEKCMDEFYSTRTIYWDYTETEANKSLPLERSDEVDVKNAVVDLSKKLFLKLRERIIKNVLLKFYNFFLVPIQSELATEIQGKVNCYTDSTLETIFEVGATKDKLQKLIKETQADLDRASEQDKMFLEFANSFSRPITFEAKR